MPNYDFSTLSSVDFEQLTRDLLQAQLGVRLQSFKRGKDGGIDLRYSTIRDPRELIVQCKHYVETDAKTLIRQLESSELPKVRVLSPTRYILSTSTPLLPQHIDAIVNLFKPYMQSAQDCLGRDDINALLLKHPLVEQSHFKLWLASSGILQRILHSSIYSRSESKKNEILRKIKIFVQTPAIGVAQQMLDKCHCCIVSGIPGVGKTSLAEMLLLEFLADDWELVEISEDTEEAWAALAPSRKQVFYYDDFLGQTSLALSPLRKNEDVRLVEIIKTVAADSTKRLILTTREYLLADAKQRFERLSHANLDLYKIVVDMGQYGRRSRANILYNHMYFSSLPREYVEALISSNVVRAIIDHPNYNPRVVEWLTKWDFVKTTPSCDYPELCIRVLNTPEELWTHTYSTQISELGRCILQVLATFSTKIAESALRRAVSLLSKARAVRLNQSRTEGGVHDRTQVDRRIVGSKQSNMG